MALTKEALELLLNQQKEFMENQKEARRLDMEQLNENRKSDMIELKNMISESVESVNKQVKDLEIKQGKDHGNIVTELKEITGRQDTADSSNLNLQSRVSDLETEVNELKKALADKPTFATICREGTKDAANINETRPINAVNSSESDDVKIRRIVDHAKKVIGLHPINAADIRRQGVEHNTEDENEKVKFAVREYLRYELKMNHDTIKSLPVEKIWKPNRDDFDRVYVEFSHEMYVNLCFRHAFKMRKEARLIIYKPPQFFERSKVIEDIAYELREEKRNTENPLQTRLRYSAVDLILLKKTKDQSSWMTVKIDNLPPIDLSFSSMPKMPSISKSPAEGRKRIEKKARSPPTPPDHSKEKVAKVDETNDEDKQDEAAHRSPTYSPNTTPSKPNPIKDIGKFSLTAARSPSLLKNPKLLNKTSINFSEFNFSP